MMDPDEMTPEDWKRRLSPSVALAWCAFDGASGLPSRVRKAAPILFFGDHGRYRTSPLRVLTVGMNPSREEFPSGRPFQRFRLLAGDGGDRDLGRYLDALSAYFRTDPYSRWFDNLEPVLNGAGASYYAGKMGSTALHTDICSPVATDPTWSKLSPDVRATLEADGGPLWHGLLEVLRPQIVLLSVAREKLGRINFASITGWKTVHRFERTGSGRPRSRPYEVRARWYKVGGGRSLFVFGPAAQTPFGLLDKDNQRPKTGAIALKAYLDGR